jgi:hypothetical protein
MPSGVRLSENLANMSLSNRAFRAAAFLLGSAAIAVACGGGGHLASGAGGSGGGGGAKGDAGSSQGPPIVTDGARLKARYFVGADGSRAPTGTWIDTKLVTECSFRAGAVAPTADTLCAPTPLSILTLVYGDAACSTPVALGGTVGAGTYASAGDEVGVPSRIFKIGAQRASAKNLYLKQPGSCVPSPLNTGELHNIDGPGLAAADFVSAKILP